MDTSCSVNFKDFLVLNNKDELKKMYLYLKMSYQKIQVWYHAVQVCQAVIQLRGLYDKLCYNVIAISELNQKQSVCFGPG